MTFDSAYAGVDDTQYESLHRPQQQACDATTEHPSQSDDLNALQKQSTRLQHLLRVMPAGVIVLDGKGIVRQVNEQAIELLGEPLQGQLWRTIIVRAFKPRADDGHEVSLRDGRRVKLSITPLMDEPGQLIVLTDLTETRQLQDRISHMQRLSALGRMVASLAHQIRTPLSSAMLYAANLKSTGNDADMRDKFSSKLIDRLQDLETQVNDMLLFAKSGEQQVVEPLNVESLLHSTCAAMDSIASAHQAEISVKIDTDMDSPPVVIANHTALSGAIQNLLHNGLQLGQSPPCVTLVLQSNQQSIFIHVEDNGPGIAIDDTNQLFEPFFTTRTQGTGLGLAVVRQVARSHGGDVRAMNMKNGGARFTIELPRHSGDSQPDVHANPTHSEELVGGNA
ncbi:sensor histidine kinase [Aestuariibacter salexigens]|uniref:sensor histidine kinase n=1 Tax=Aestuariibacter salexigens TaxID=226010 RepID=UPI000423A159|nr:ATP-binding protein [Aestuariibacter salexigens]